MKRKNSKIFKVLEVIFLNISMAYIVLITYTNLPLFLDYRFSTVNAPYFDLVLLVVGALSILFYYRNWYLFVSNPGFAWGTAVVLMFLVNHFLFLNIDKLVDQEEIWYDRNRIERFILFFILGFLLLNTNTETVLRYLKVASFLIPTIIILDFFFTDLFASLSEDKLASGRAEGTFINPNLAGEATLVTLVLVISHIRGLSSIFLFALCGLAVILTFSRAGMVFWVVLGVLYVMSGKLPRASLLLFIAAVLSYSYSLPLIEDRLNEKFPDNPGYVANMMSRISIFEEGVAQIDDDSATGRAQLARDGLAGFFDSPILGNQFSDAQSHNMIIDWAYIFGITGVFMWGWMLWLLFNKGANRRIFSDFGVLALAYLWFSFYTHNLLETFFWQFAIAMALFGTTDLNRTMIREREPVPHKKRSRRRRTRWA